MFFIKKKERESFNEKLLVVDLIVYAMSKSG